MDRIRVMISSLCNLDVNLKQGPVSLTEIRRKIKGKILNTKLFNTKIFEECWICEDLEGVDGYAIEACKEKVDFADILLVLYLGDAGKPLIGEELRWSPLFGQLNG